MLEQINYHLSPIDETIIEFTSADFSSITTKQDLHNLFLSKIPTTDTSILDSSSTTFAKSISGVAFRYGSFRNSPITTYYQPIIKFKNTPIPSSVSLSGYYLQVSNTLMYFIISVQKISDNSYFRVLLVCDQSADTGVYPSDGIFINNAIIPANHIISQKLSDTINVKIILSSQSGFKSFIGTDKYCNINIESPTDGYSSSGGHWKTYPFYLKSLNISF